MPALNFKTIVLICLVNLISLGVSGEQAIFSYEDLSLNPSLPVVIIEDVYKDEKGMLWFKEKPNEILYTSSLFKYGGKTFENVKLKDSRLEGLQLEYSGIIDQNLLGYVLGEDKNTFVLL